MPRAKQDELKFIVSLASSRLKDLKAGEGLAARTGYSIAELVGKATVERLTLSAHFHRQSVAALKSKPPAHRLAVSRGYYSMYHCFRAVVFYTNEGDEYEKHSELPKHLPADFPSVSLWENTLKNARLNRNRADYEPFPRGDSSFKSIAEQLVADAKALQRIAKTYLRGKGLSL